MNNKEKVATGGVSITNRKALTLVFIKKYCFAIFCFFLRLPEISLLNIKCI